jgi:hypothetical protein
VAQIVSRSHAKATSANAQWSEQLKQISSWITSVLVVQKKVLLLRKLQPNTSSNYGVNSSRRSQLASPTFITKLKFTVAAIAIAIWMLAKNTSPIA